MAAQADVSTLKYEQALAELESLIQRLERGDVALDEAVACYQRGSALAQRCADLLDRTEATVLQLVVGGGGGDEERPLRTAEEAPAAGRVRLSIAEPAPAEAAEKAERPMAPPPPGSPARARSVPLPQRPQAPAAAAQASPPSTRPAPATPPPGLFPEPSPADDEAGFDLDDIPF